MGQLKGFNTIKHPDIRLYFNSSMGQLKVSVGIAGAVFILFQFQHGSIESRRWK